jgi:hypothetical protein
MRNKEDAMDNYDEIYPLWMQRWNAWTRRTDARIIGFFAELGVQVREAVSDLQYRLDRWILGPHKDEQVRASLGPGNGNYEFWRHRLEESGELPEGRPLPEDRW